MPVVSSSVALDSFHACTRDWFLQAFDQPTQVQSTAWPEITAGRSTLLLAPTGSGKTLAAFLAAIDRLFFSSLDTEAAATGVRVLYISPLKALGVDVDRNLRAPLAGLRAFAEREGVPHHVPTVAVRSGDTTQRERQQIVRNPPDILITTPESLYLMLTSKAEAILAGVETIIIDEIHALAGTKRGSHLFTTLERLERLRIKTSDEESADTIRPLQRIGLSATQRPLEEIALLLGGGAATANPEEAVRPRPVQIVDASAKRRFDLTIETPAEEEDRTPAEEQPYDPENPVVMQPTNPSVWPAIHPRLVELIRQHRSTIVFVNSRRLAERLAGAVNELAEEEIALAHHGSIAKETRALIEDRLKRGDLPAMIATSSMELGIDMGAVDLVIQIEAPPSIASGTQRIGRSGHQVGAVSTGVIFPKFKGDLLACSAATGAMHEGWVEATRFPRNPLDILAQQVVAMTSRESLHVDEIFSTLRSAAPFFELPYSSFISVLDLLSGRYPSDEFSELRPRINWDRITGIVSPRKGAQRLAILNAGTIPDRGLYGVYLVGNDGESAGRVGELDEEMVFECRPGDVFLLGASSWRVMDITRDRVLVVPAPGEPGRMPFWRGDGPGRPLEFGQAIGRLSRELTSASNHDAIQRLTTEHGLNPSAAESLLEYLNDQVAAVEDLPSDRTIVIESFLDEIGDWRIVVLTPFGSRVHAPWATLIAARLRQETSDEVDVMWTDDGMAFRIPDAYDVPTEELFFPEAQEVEQELVHELGTTALFAARFRENAARSLLLPRRSPNRRTPLWLQRRRSGDLLKVAARFHSFPIITETYRECLRDIFDVDGLRQILTDVHRRAIRVKSVRTEHPSPFAGSILFSYVGNFIYDGDAPLAERRAQTLSLDHNQLRELIGTVDFRSLLDQQVIDVVEHELQRLTGWPLNHPDDLHGLLLHLGPLTKDEIERRCDRELVTSGQITTWLEELQQQRRIFRLSMAGEQRLAAAEEAGRLRDALGVMPPQGLADAFLQPVQDALVELVSQFARTHGPFSIAQAASHLGLGIAPVTAALQTLEQQNRVISGEFRPGQVGQEWCDNNVLRLIKRRTLASLRQEVEPVEPETLARFLPEWHGLTRRRKGLDGLLDVVEQLQGTPLHASTLEAEILPARLERFGRSDLDELCVQGEVMWRGFAGTGPTDGRIGLFLTDLYRSLAPPSQMIEGEEADVIRQVLTDRGALLFEQLAEAVGGFPNDLLQTVWQMVWAGELTNDTLTPLRTLRSTARQKGRGDRRTRAFRSRRKFRLPGSEGRWSLLPQITSGKDAPAADGSVVPGTEAAFGPQATTTERQMAIALQLTERHGVLTKEMLAREEVEGGFSGLYPVLKALEESGRIRRGYFVAGLGAAQFATPGAEDQLRSFREPADEVKPMILAATDPANPWGNALSWPETNDAGRPQRVAGARIIVADGRLLGYLGRTGEHLMTFRGEGSSSDPDAADLNLLLEALKGLAAPGRPVLLSKIDGQAAADAALSADLQKAGFTLTGRGLLLKSPYSRTR
ncbi:MAG: ATP-dependent helicase [Fuerstiella sp.]